MPLLRKQPFVNEKTPPGLKPDDEVFFCRITNEVFTDYEKFFERIILCNSLVWTCSETGRTGLTFQEAVESEEKARRQIACFPEYLLKPVLLLASMTHRTRINDVNDDVYTFARDRYFLKETVDVLHDGEKKACKVMKVIAPNEGKSLLDKEKKCDDDIIILDSDEEEDMPLSKLQKNPSTKDSAFGESPEKYQYVVQELKKPNIYIVEAKQVSRKKGLYTRDRNKFFLKKHCEPGIDAIWRLKKQPRLKHRIDDLKWREYFEGDMPKFGVAKAKKSGKKNLIDLTNEDAMMKQARKERKAMRKMEKEMKKMDKEQKKEMKKQRRAEQRKRLREEKQRMKEQETLEEKLRKMSAEERVAYREQIKQEKLAEKMAEKMAKKEEVKKLWEEEKLRRKEERDKLREKKKEEDRERKEYLKEYNKPREDLECDDLKPLPRPKPVQCRVPVEYFGDAIMVLEYLNCFNSLLEMDDQFPEQITLDALGDALQDTSVNGLFADLVSFLLTTIFQLEEEEEEYDDEDDVEEKEEIKVEHEDVSFRELVKQATVAAQIPHQHYGTALNKLHIDGFTLTEILRLHFLASGAKGSERNNRFRFKQRGGYSSTDDAGLEFKRQEAAVIKALGESNMFDLNPGDKLKILTALIHQLMTYVACRDVIEENFETLRTTRNEQRNHQWAEGRREKDETTFWYKKRMEERAREKEEKAKGKDPKKKDRVEQLKGDQNKEDVIDLCDSRPSSRGADSQSSSRPGTPTTSPEQNKKARSNSKGYGFKELLEQRHSGRLNSKKHHHHDVDFEIPSENLEWDRITPDDRIAMRNHFEKKEMDFFEAISELQHSNAIHPVGRDRSFRRYWTFRSLEGVFVEDAEEYVGDDFFDKLCEQIEDHPKQSSFKSDNLPLKSGNENEKMVNGEEKCGNSDKENESFDQNKANLEALDATSSVQQKDIVAMVTDSNSNGVTRNVNTPDIIIEDTESESTQRFDTVKEQINNRNKVRWSYYNTEEELDILIENLNSRGYREGPLKQALQEQRQFLANKLALCPVSMLSISKLESDVTTVRFQKVKRRNRKVQGQVTNASASEFLELNIREQLLDLEERICIGGLGNLKVTARLPWREAIEYGNYDPQCDTITWCNQTETVKARFSKLSRKTTGAGDGNEDEAVVEHSQDDDDDDDSNANLVIRDMSRALLQLSHMVEPKFLQPPLGEDDETRSRKQKEALDLAFQGLTPRKIKEKVWLKKNVIRDENGDVQDISNNEEPEEEEGVKNSGMDRWQETLMNATSLSQVFLHLSVLDHSIIWDKSALHARCTICRRKGDDEKMLLCDGCDNGYHMYCLKPPIKKIPKDDWYCMRCKPKDVAPTPKKRRRSIFIQETEDEKSEVTEEESSEDEDSDDETEDDDESDDETEDYDEDTEIDDQDTEEAQPAKIKFLKGFKGKGGRTTDSERNSSRGGSARSSRSNTPTHNGVRTPKSRTSLEKAIQMKAVASKSTKGEKRKSSRHSIETDAPSARKSSRSLSPYSKESKSSRLSLDPSSLRGKRKFDCDDSEPSPPTKVRRRGSEKLNMMQSCEELLTELSKRDESWPFQAPVTRRDAPDYFDVIKQPMDFGTIRKKLFEVEYSCPQECLDDMRIVFSNCAIYNMPQASEYQAGQKLSRYLEKRVKELNLEPKTKSRPNSPSKNKASPSTSGRKKRK